MLKTHTLRDLGARIVLAAFGVAVGLVAVEVGLRLLAPSEVRERSGLHELRPDRAWLYGMRAGVTGHFDEPGGIRYRVNADGFRDRLYARPKPEGVWRIVVLGDSLAFGSAVAEEDTFPKVLETRLAKLVPEARVEVMNLGVSGYNPYTEARLLEDVGVTYEPDLVLVQFCINDLNDPTFHFDVQTRQRLGSIPDAAYPDPSKRRAPVQAPGWLFRSCRRLRTCTRLDELWLSWTLPEPDEAARRAAAVPVEGLDAPEWIWLEARYGEMADAAARAGSRFAVLAFPYQAQLGRRGPEPVQTRLVKLGRRRGWLTVDPLAAFRRSATPGRPLFLDWWHPTPAGHRLAAAETLRALACGGLLPAPARRLCLGGSDAAAPGQ
jgi:hypothetical protein